MEVEVKEVKQGAVFSSIEEIESLLLAGHGVVVRRAENGWSIFDNPINLRYGMLQKKEGINSSLCKRLHDSLEVVKHRYPEEEAIIITNSCKKCSKVCNFGCEV